MHSAPADIRGARALYIHRYLFRLALSAGNIFAWVFVFRAFFIANGDAGLALAGVGALYIVSQGIAIILTPLTGAALQNGVRRALIYGTLTAAFAFVLMTAFFAEAYVSQTNAFWLIAGFAVLMGMHRALYWVPYRTATEHAFPLTTPFTSAREISVALMPLFAGLCIESMLLGAPALFSLVALGIVASIFLLAAHPEYHERFEWSYRETFRALVSRQNRAPLTLSILDGIQGAALLLIWPLAVFLIIGQSYALLGAIISATLVIAFLMRGPVRRGLRAFRIERSTPVLASIAFSAWVLRLAAGTPIQILLVDAYYHGGVPAKRFSIDAHGSDQAADGGHFVDEYTALKEMGLAIGRIIACSLLVILALLATVPAAIAVCLIAAGIAAAWSVVLSRRLVSGIY